MLRTLAATIAVSTIAVPYGIQAQTVLPDQTLPTTVSKDSTIRLFTITGGSAQGSNLFHSFGTFSPENFSVLFDLTQIVSGSEIERIFSRVTGENASEINGSLAILGGNMPDLFLLNPNGILFGPNAQLNVGGSFVGTTADAIQFSDGESFSAVAPQISPLLSVSVPVGLQLGANPGAIAIANSGHRLVRSELFDPLLPTPNAPPLNGLQVSPGQTFALVGNNIQLDGGILESRRTLIPNAQEIPLGGVQFHLGSATNGTVQFQTSPEGWQFDYGDIQDFGDITFSNRTLIDGSGVLPSKLNIRGQNLSITGGSVLRSVNFGELSGGDINLAASGRIQVQSDSNQSSEVSSTAFASGASSSIHISAESLDIFGSANIASASFGEGDTGAVNVFLSQDLRLDSFTANGAPTANLTAIATPNFGSGNASPLNVQARRIFLQNGSVISSSSFDSGQGGDINITAIDSLLVQGVHPVLGLPSSIAADSLGTGNAGENVTVQTKRLEILDSATIRAGSLAAGDAGNVFIEASESVTIGGKVPTLPFSAQIGSNVTNNPLSQLEELSSGDPTGNAGGVTIITPDLRLFNSGQITVQNDGAGEAGNIEILADAISLEDNARITAQTTSGVGGSINIFATESITLRRGSSIVASALGGQQGDDGGNIAISTQSLIARPEENSDISADAVGSSSGGMVEIIASPILGLSEQSQPTAQSDITASSELGTQGTVELSQLDANLTSGITELPSSFSAQDQTPIVNACSSDSAQLALKGRGGLPLGPNNLLHDTLKVAGDNDPINQAIALRNQGFYSKALKLLLSEVTSLEIDTPQKRQAIALRQIGITHKLLEQHRESKTALKQSLSIAQKINDPEQISATLLSLGNLVRAENDIEQARQHYQQALDENPSQTLQHQILANQLSLEVATGQNNIVRDMAKDLLNDLAGRVSDPLQLTTRINVSATLLRHQQLNAVPNFLSFLYQDLKGARLVNDPKMIAYALGHLGQAYEQTKQWEKAQQFSAAALQLAQNQQDIFQEYQWSWQLARIGNARWQTSGDSRWRSQAQAAYEIALNALKQLRGDLATVSPALQFSFRNRVEPVYREYVNLLLASQTADAASAGSPSTFSPAEQETLQKALQTIEDLRLAELDNFLQDACLTARPQSIEQQDPEAAVLYPIILQDRIAVLCSHRGHLQFHTLPISPEELNATVQEFRKQLVTRSRLNFEQPSQQLYDWLIRPALKGLNQATIKTLIFVPDGSLKNVPLAALFDGKQFLIEQFNIAIAPGLQLLPSQTSQAVPPHALTAGVTHRHQGFGRLVYADQEIEQVQSLFPGKHLLNESFTRDSLQQGLLETQAPIVHIATHGQFSSKASETFLLAWNERINIQQLHEILQSRDRHDLSPIELLVLSACETAVGDEAAALGLAGIAVRAGARSTLASLWNVDDESTTLLMQQFYQQFSQPLSSRSEALREAQLAMLKHPRYGHPYYWSAFVLLGSWQ